MAAARRALTAPAWAGSTPTQRGKLLYRLADLVAENAQTLAEIETRDTGKIIRETSAQITYVADYYRYYAGLADKIQGAHLPIDKPDMEVWLRREPVGVVAAIVPWNSQLFLVGVKLGPALAAGCTVVLKASEDGPGPLLEFARLVDAAGFPPGVVNVLTGFGADCGARLTTHPQVDHVAFTGGPGKRPAISFATRPRIWPARPLNWVGNPPSSCSTTRTSTAPSMPRLQASSPPPDRAVWRVRV